MSNAKSYLLSAVAVFSLVASVPQSSAAQQPPTTVYALKAKKVKRAIYLRYAKMAAAGLSAVAVTAALWYWKNDIYTLVFGETPKAPASDSTTPTTPSMPSFNNENEKVKTTEVVHTTTSSISQDVPEKPAIEVLKAQIKAFFEKAKQAMDSRDDSTIPSDLYF